MTTPEQLVRIDRFRMVPDALIFDPLLSPQAKHLYAILLTYSASESGVGWPGLEGVRNRIAGWADTLGKPQGFQPPSLATLKRAMAELERARWIARKRRRNTSTLTFVCGWRGQRPPWEAPTLESSNMSPPESSKVSPRNSSKLSPRTKERERDQVNDLSVDVAKFVYDNRPNNAHEYLALRAVARKLLAAKHSPEAVRHAMVNAATVTVNACEIELRRNRPTKRQQIVQPTAETGRVDD